MLHKIEQCLAEAFVSLVKCILFTVIKNVFLGHSSLRWVPVEPNPHQSGFLTDSPHRHRCLFLMAQPIQSIINIGRGYHLQSSEHENKPLSTFPSNILHFPLVAPPGLILCHILKAKTHNPHRTTITRSSPIMSGFRPLVLYR
jgi:hypothetical protein